MEPIISTKGRSTQLRYELPHRIYDSKIYPVKAPNNSTIILNGSEIGVDILWRGGHPLKKTPPPPKQASKPPPKVNGTKDAIMIIDSDEDEPSKAAPQTIPHAEFELEEEELDPDHPYPSIIQQLHLPLNTGVVHIAVPQLFVASELRADDTQPPIFSKKMVFAVACTDYSVRVITLPLSPPPAAAKERPLGAKSLYGEEVLKIPTYAGHQTIPRGVSLTWTSRAKPSHRQSSEDEMDLDGDGDTAVSGRRSPRKRQPRPQSVTSVDDQGFDILVASHSSELGGLVKLWRFNLTETSVKTTNPIAPYQTVTLRKPATTIAFNTAKYPKRRHSQLLITDSLGIARIYDAFAPRKRRATGTSSEPGAFVALFRASFESTKANTPIPAILASRKAIVDVAWACDGRRIVALLADGEWGVWDVDRSGSIPHADPAAFSLRGFVGTSESERASGGASSPKSRSNRSSLVPMTPNTRRRKEETLFHGTTTSSSVPPRGGVSVASSFPTNGGEPEESVMIWYGTEVHKISDLAKFWSRTTSKESGSSLLSPGLAQLYDIPLLGQSIASVTQFDSTVREARMALPRDILIAAEHRLIIVANTNRPLGRDLNAVFAKEQAEEEETRRTDQALLSRGELDLGGMDRMLEDMEGSGSRSLVLGNPRKVLFASSTA